MPDLAVLDTNVWLDWLVFDDPGIARLRRAVAQGGVQLIATAWMRDELGSVLARPLITARLAQAALRIAEFDALIQLCDPAPACRLVCTDPADQAFIDLATQRSARWLITKDRALLRLGRGARERHRLAVVTPAGFAAAFPPDPSSSSPSP